MKAVIDRLAAVLAMPVSDLPVNVSPDAKELAQQMRRYHTVLYPDGTPLANKKRKRDVKDDAKDDAKDAKDDAKVAALWKLVVFFVFWLIK
jgi:hypothetical protein